MRASMAVGLALFVLLLAAPAAPAGGAPVFAAAGAAGAAGEHHGAKPEGDLDVFKGGVELTIWSIVVFLILFLLLSKYAWPQIREGLEKREQAIAHDKHEAVKAKQEADALRRQLAAKMAEVHDEIRQMMDKARADAQATAAEELARGRAEVAADRERLKRELQISSDDALHKMWDQAARLATLISAKAIHKQLQYDDHRALLNEALAEFRQAAEGRKQDLESARA
jgi:F-type H+-transporting ATPase subunit b